MQRGNKWLPGTILSKEGSVTYDVEMATGRVRKCHTDQLRIRTVPVEPCIPTHSPLTSSIPVSSSEAGQTESPDVQVNRPEEPESNESVPNLLLKRLVTRRLSNKLEMNQNHVDRIVHIILFCDMNQW